MAAVATGVSPSAQDYEFIKCLGKGYFGEVWHARHVVSNSEYAVKKVRQSLINEHRLGDQLQREIKILYSLDHRRIVRLRFDFVDGKHVYLGMDLAKGGSLFDKLSSVGKFSAADSARYFYEVCEALSYLHGLEQKVIHRDIKPENILLDAEDHAKLADFGWANQMKLEAEKRDTFCGTLDYLAPEMIMGTGHNESVDLWSMGVLLFEMASGTSPFSSSSKDKTCRRILAVELRYPGDLDQDACDLIAALCKKKPSERLCVEDAMSHKFVTKFVSESETSRPEEEEQIAPRPDGRPSVMGRHLRSVNERMQREIEISLQQKQKTEEQLLEVIREAQGIKVKVQVEKERRAEVEAACLSLMASNATRSKDLEGLRREAAKIEAEVAKLKRGGVRGLFARRPSREMVVA